MFRTILASLCMIFATFSSLPSALADEPAKAIRIGMIGLDTSHCLAFADLLNKGGADPALVGCKVILVYPKGSPDIESSVKRVPEYTEKIKAMGVEVIDDLDAMITQVDAVLLETNDGRPHLEQVLPVLNTTRHQFSVHLR
jgi:hypothetical protein